MFLWVVAAEGFEGHFLLVCRKSSETRFSKNQPHLHALTVLFIPGASKLDASESASEQEEDFELISDEELRSATNEDDDNDDGDNSK